MLKNFNKYIERTMRHKKIKILLIIIHIDYFKMILNDTSETNLHAHR